MEPFRPGVNVVIYGQPAKEVSAEELPEQIPPW